MANIITIDGELKEWGDRITIRCGPGEMPTINIRSTYYPINGDGTWTRDSLGRVQARGAGRHAVTVRMEDLTRTVSVGGRELTIAEIVEGLTNVVDLVFRGEWDHVE